MRLFKNFLQRATHLVPRSLFTSWPPQVDREDRANASYDIVSDSVVDIGDRAPRGPNTGDVPVYILSVEIQEIKNVHQDLFDFALPVLYQAPEIFLIDLQINNRIRDYVVRSICTV